MKKPVIALVGRPNVGKSTLFNRLTRTRDAIVADYSGLTRDRQYGTGRVGNRPYIVIDTGGLSGDSEGVDPLMKSQVMIALKEADVILFMSDGRESITSTDKEIADFLRRFKTPIYLLVNKTEGYDKDMAVADFYQLGFGQPYPIASAHGDNIPYVMDKILNEISVIYDSSESLDLDSHPGIRVAVIGRPNVGKSTLINRMIGEDRVVAFDMPGTTRDSIFVPFERDGQLYTLIDTAGVRKRRKISEKIEKFSIVKAIEAMTSSNVVVILVDGSEGVTDQDLTLLGLALESGRGLIIAVNKWDNLDVDQRSKVKHELSYKLQFVSYAEQHLISALHGTGVGDLFTTICSVYNASMKRVSTSDLNRVLKQATEDHQPPLVSGRRIKLRYAHIGGLNPPTVIVHGNQVDKLSSSYSKYLMSFFRKAFKWEGTPVSINYKVTENPFEGRKNRFSEQKLSTAKNQEQQKKLQKKKYKKKKQTTKRRTN